MADAAALLAATQGRDPLDATTLAADQRLGRLLAYMGMGLDDIVGHATTGGYIKSKPGFPLWGWRVGVPREYDVAELSDEVRAAWSAAAAACESLGATVVPVSLPHTAAALAAYYIVAPAEASSNLARYDAIRFGGAQVRRHHHDDGSGGGKQSEAAEAVAAVVAAAGEALREPTTARGTSAGRGLTPVHVTLFGASHSEQLDPVFWGREHVSKPQWSSHPPRVNTRYLKSVMCYTRTREPQKNV